jgi:hypothetical protein
MGMKVQIICIAALGMVSVFSTCKKKFGCANSVYSFETHIRSYPDTDSVHVNDTIWLEFSSPVQLKDTLLNKIIDYSQAENLGTAISFDELIGGDFYSPGGKDAADSFISVVLIGKVIPVSNPGRIKAYNFIEINGEYRFKIAVIPKSKGIYCLSPSDASNVYRKKDACTKAYFRITFSETNQHIYYYRQNRPAYTPSQYELTHMYCFKVY